MAPQNFTNIDSLIKFYSKYKGKSLFELNYEIESNYDIHIKTNKGVVGQILEGLIGNPPNSNPNSDVFNLGVELKVLPLRKVSNKLQPKERSKIKSLNYNKIISENWKNSEIRNKIRLILFLKYEQPIGKNYKDWKHKDFKFLGPLLFVLESNNENIIQKDWEEIKEKVVNENAKEISEGDGVILGACTSGTGKLQIYGNNKTAKQRSYSLKHSYLKQYYLEENGVKYESIQIPKEISPHDFLLQKITQKIQGEYLDELAARYKLNFASNAKDGFHSLIKKILNIDEKSNVREIDLLGIEIKTVPVNDNLSPWQAMSFPKFSLVDILNEEWIGSDEHLDNNIEVFDNESTFKNQIARPFIFIPIIKNKIGENYEDWRKWKIGKPVLWIPNSEELEIIRQDWEKAKSIIKREVITSLEAHGAGYRQINNLLKEGQKNENSGKIIHIRPHTSNSKNIDKPYADYTNGRVKICWQSFWLNKKFVRSVLLK